MKPTHYRGSIDGDIRKYLKEMKDIGVTAPSFQGYEPYKLIWDMGVMEPGIANIRLVHGNTYGLYYVVDGRNVEGSDDMMYAGKKGVFDAEELLTSIEVCFWEVSGLDPRAYRG